MTPASYENYDISVPQAGTYKEILNSEKDIYDGCNMCNFEPVKAEKRENPVNGFDYKLMIRIAPFAAIWFTCRKHADKTEKAKAQ